MSSYTAFLFDPLSPKLKIITITRNQAGSSIGCLQRHLKGYPELLPPVDDDCGWVAYVSENKYGTVPNHTAWGVLSKLGLRSKTNLMGTLMGRVVLCRIDEVGNEIPLQHHHILEVELAQLDYLHPLTL